MDKLSDLFEKSWRRRAPRTPRDSPDADLSETAGDDTTTSAATPTPPTRRGRHPHRGPNGPAPVSGPSGNGTGSRTPVTMAYDMANGTDAKDAQAKSSGLKVDFDRQDVEFWFEQLEMHMFGCGLAAQWTNRMVLHKMLPPDIVSEIKDLLRKNQASAGETPYKDIKDSLLETFGQKRADAFAQADALVMTGKPSQLLHKLINILCKHHPDLVGCCAEGTITGMWRKKLNTHGSPAEDSRLQPGGQRLDETPIANGGCRLRDAQGAHHRRLGRRPVQPRTGRIGGPARAAATCGSLQRAPATKGHRQEKGPVQQQGCTRCWRLWRPSEPTEIQRQGDPPP